MNNLEFKVGQKGFIKGGSASEYEITEVYEYDLMTTFGNLKIHKNSFVRTECEAEINTITVIKA